MEVDAELIGVDETLRRMSKFIERQEEALELALEMLLRKMVNYVKNNGPWSDRTSNLRNSISANIEQMQEWPADTDTATLASKASNLEKPVIDVDGDDYTAVLSAGMEYAIWVETKSGFWVLQGAIDKFEPIIERHLADYIHVDNIDLDSIARQVLGGEAS